MTRTHRVAGLPPFGCPPEPWVPDRTPRWYYAKQRIRQTGRRFVACAAALQGSGGIDGTCSPAAKYTNPHHDNCPTQAGVPCGPDGTCSGTGSCNPLAKAGTACGAVSCNGTGGVSGAALRPVGVLATARVARAVKVPVIGAGGIATVGDIVQYLLAGASLVAIGTAALQDPRLPERLVTELRQWCYQHRIHTLADVIGRLEWAS